MPTAVVTGCNSGIGYAIAKILIRDGYKTFATSRSNGPKLKELEGLGAKTAVLDVGNKDNIDAFKREHIGEEDVHLLINNAGMSCSNTPRFRPSTTSMTRRRVIGLPMISRLEPQLRAPYSLYTDSRPIQHGSIILWTNQFRASAPQPWRKLSGSTHSARFSSPKLCFQTSKRPPRPVPLPELP